MRSPNPMNLLATKKNVDRLRRFKLKLTRPDRSTSPQRLEAAAATLQLSSGDPPSPVQLLGHRVEALRVSARHAVVAPLEPVEIPISTDAEPTSSTVAPPRHADESAAAPDDESRPAELDHADDDESTSESESPAGDSSSSFASCRRKRDADCSKQPSTGSSSPLGDADRFEELVEHEHREKLMRAWRRTHRFRTVPCPSAPPLYLNEPLELMWSETDTVTRRRLFNRDKYADTPHASPPPRNNLRAGDQRTSPPPPPLKANRTYHLRNAFAKRRPIVSAYFERHYTAHRKPPFKRFNVKFVN